MIVYIAERGELGEGGSVIGVYDTYEKAEKRCKSTRCCFGGGWQPDGDDEWTNGCDYIRVREFEVQ